tara:strand:- start:30040 stop:30252 length:213 start_codon:yes stop_codon:yes gene_type:complete
MPQLTRQQLPVEINSPLSGDTLKLVDIGDHNDEQLSVYTDYIYDSPEWYDGYVAMYKNEETRETLYIPHD